jgi:hypothetical protein
MQTHERLEQPPVVWHTHVKQLVHDYEILEFRRPIKQILRERDDAAAGARTPLP